MKCFAEQKIISKQRQKLNVDAFGAIQKLAVAQIFGHILQFLKICGRSGPQILVESADENVSEEAVL